MNKISGIEEQTGGGGVKIGSIHEKQDHILNWFVFFVTFSYEDTLICI